MKKLSFKLTGKGKKKKIIKNYKFLKFKNKISNNHTNLMINKLF
jgi:hypothetical protein